MSDVLRVSGFKEIIVQTEKLARDNFVKTMRDIWGQNQVVSIGVGMRK